LIVGKKVLKYYRIKKKAAMPARYFADAKTKTTAGVSA
jgi:hypothetical protein